MLDWPTTDIDQGTHPRDNGRQHGRLLGTLRAGCMAGCLAPLTTDHVGRPPQYDQRHGRAKTQAGQVAGCLATPVLDSGDICRLSHCMLA